MRREPEKAANALTARAGSGGTDPYDGPCEEHSDAPGAVDQGVAGSGCAPVNSAAGGLAADSASHDLPGNPAANGLPAKPAANGLPANPASNGLSNGAHPRLDRAPAIVRAAGVDIGGAFPILIGSIGRGEDGEALGHAARSVAEVGGQFLHWGTIEPGAMSYGGEPLSGLSLARKTADACGLGLVGDVEAAEDIAPVAELADLIHVPPHLMQCFALLLEAGRAGRPVILSRSPAATLEEWLLAAEYLMVGGCPGIVLCEAGIRGFDHPERPVLDLGAVATLRLTHRLPVIVAPGRAAGRSELIQPLARAALAAGAHGLLLPFLLRGARP